ncbi:MAG TPA: Asp23/Gls24 family envelope stress response protein [Terriglobales bacterium]|nr:Asp23/Gls24 family envelope stress response protein [Candidatus Acidoferrum sp.]HWQ50892.1 Asp23/Gls24 family envelope stress response protein [Terriglobales bacterium]
MVKLENSYGEIEISGDVLAEIVGRAANECFGVAGMAPKDVTEGLVSLFRRSAMDKGVRVFPMGGDLISIELHIVVVYGLNISAVADSIMQKVKYMVEEQTGLVVHEITVYVDAMKA